MSEANTESPIERLDQLVNSAPSAATVKTEEKAKLQKFVLPLLDKFRTIEKRDEELRGSRYYCALCGDLKIYSKFLTQSHAVEMDREKVWRNINETYKKITGQEFPGRKGKGEAELLDQILYQDDDMVSDHMVRDKAILMGFGVGTEKLRHNVTSPEELLKELYEYRKEVLAKARTEFPADDEEKAAERAALLDDQFGFHRIAIGVGRAALQANDFHNAGISFGFARSIGRLSEEDADIIYDKVHKLPAREKADFIDAFRVFFPTLPVSKKGKIE